MPDGQRLGKNTMAKDETIVGMLDLLGLTVDCNTQPKAERFTFFEEGRWVTITVGYHRWLVSKGKTHWVCRSHPIFGVSYRRASSTIARRHLP